MLTLAILVLGGFFLYFVGYRLYGSIIDREIVRPDDAIPVPAETHDDDVDYAKAPMPVLFGHHFASIAGAGPIVGPIVALANFGWAATLAWILIGSVLVGAVHDYVSLMLSVNNEGRSISDIAEEALGHRARGIFSAFVLLALILIVAVFMVLAAQTLLAQPSLVIPTFGTILLALLFGLAVYRFGVPLLTASVVAFAANIGLLATGYYFPLDIKPVMGDSSLVFWIVVLGIYAGIASVLPVRMLLQPRDYISTFNLYVAMVLGILALVVIHPDIKAPALSSFSGDVGPMWPMLFVVVACGAISGFHSLVASGTTSKQLAKQSDGRRIGLGAMLLEGMLALMTLLMVAGALSWSSEADEALRFSAVNAKGSLVVFGTAYGKIVSDMLPGLGMTMAMMIGLITINIFVLTTLDTATRITRFMVQEYLGKSIAIFDNKYLATLAIIAVSMGLALSDSWKAIWPIFGSSNQLMAAMALIVATAYYVGHRRIRYLIGPAIFMLFTTVGALVWQGYRFFAGPKPNYALGILAMVLILLAAAVAGEGLKVLRSGEKGIREKNAR